MKKNIQADFQICISVPLMNQLDFWYADMDSKNVKDGL